MIRGIGLMVIMCLLAIVFMQCETETLDCERPASNIITSTFDVENYSAVVFSTVGNLTITDDTIYHIEATGPQNVIESLEITKEETRLLISSNSCFTANYELNVKVGLPDLKGLAFTGVGNIRSSGVWTSETFSIVHGGVGNINAAIVCDSIVTDCYGTGNLSLSGSADKNYLASTSEVQFNGYELETELTDIFLSGVTSAYVKVNGVLRLLLNGFGDVYYKGNPIISSQINGPGELIDDN
jgi:hypothetical protein